MTTATSILARVNAAAQSAAFRAAAPAAALQMLHEIAFERCDVYSSSEEYGYGPANSYRFPDGSVLTDDGRGYTVD